MFNVRFWTKDEDGLRFTTKNMSSYQTRLTEFLGTRTGGELPDQVRRGLRGESQAYEAIRKHAELVKEFFEEQGIKSIQVDAGPVPHDFFRKEGPRCDDGVIWLADSVPGAPMEVKTGRDNYVFGAGLRKAAEQIFCTLNEPGNENLPCAAFIVVRPNYKTIDVCMVPRLDSQESTLEFLRQFGDHVRNLSFEGTDNLPSEAQTDEPTHDTGESHEETPQESASDGTDNLPSEAQTDEPTKDTDESPQDTTEDSASDGGEDHMSEAVQEPPPDGLVEEPIEPRPCDAGPPPEPPCYDPPGCG